MCTINTNTNYQMYHPLIYQSVQYSVSLLVALIFYTCIIMPSSNHTTEKKDTVSENWHLWQNLLLLIPGPFWHFRICGMLSSCATTVAVTLLCSLFKTFEACLSVPIKTAQLCNCWWSFRKSGRKDKLVKIVCLLIGLWPWLC